MSDDIVDRLRKRQMMQDVRGTGGRFVKQIAVPDALCQLAGDEIERLRDVVRSLNARCDHLGIRLGEVIRERDAAQPEQEPVAWIPDWAAQKLRKPLAENTNPSTFIVGVPLYRHPAPETVPIYAHPAPVVTLPPLTDEQIDAITRDLWGTSLIGVMMQAHREYAHAVLRAAGVEVKP